MIGYVTLGTDDLDRARAFYDALFATIGATRVMQLDEQHGFTMYGRSLKEPGVVVMKPYDGQAMHPGNGNMVALAMSSKEKVDALHAKALELGGTDEGAPGYFAYFRDLDGHKFAVFNLSREQ
jgi:catechol 2,3-dioxygenase-like lactoylglutathione lyase family enzyme